MTALTPGATDAPTTFTARCPDDVLALAPLLLGFFPTDSVAMMTFGATHSFHARVDLPASSLCRRDLDVLVDSLVEPAQRHGVEKVVLVVYTDDAALAGAAAARLRRAMRRAAIEIVEMLRADGERWWPLRGRDDAHRVPARGVRYDVRSHPFLVQAVLAGRVTLASREELAATLRPDAAAAARVESLLAANPAGGDALAQGEWVEQLVAQHVAAGDQPDDPTAARLLQSMLDPVVRDAACTALTRDSAPRHAELWTGILRRTPPALVAAPASLLALAAWQAGNGARAWCAVDVARSAVPDYPLAGLLAHALTAAVPPGQWGGLDWRAGLR